MIISVDTDKLEPIPESTALPTTVYPWPTSPWASPPATKADVERLEGAWKTWAENAEKLLAALERVDKALEGRIEVTEAVIPLKDFAPGGKFGFPADVHDRVRLPRGE